MAWEGYTVEEEVEVEVEVEVEEKEEEEEEEVPKRKEDNTRAQRPWQCASDDEWRARLKVAGKMLEW